MASELLSPSEPLANVRLALRLKKAARALDIGERKLWDLTWPRGPIRCVRIGTCVLYPIAELERWLAEQTAKAVQP